MFGAIGRPVQWDTKHGPDWDGVSLCIYTWNVCFIKTVLLSLCTSKLFIATLPFPPSPCLVELTKNVEASSRDEEEKHRKNDACTTGLRSAATPLTSFNWLGDPTIKKSGWSDNLHGGLWPQQVTIQGLTNSVLFKVRTCLFQQYWTRCSGQPREISQWPHDKWSLPGGNIPN